MGLMASLGLPNLVMRDLSHIQVSILLVIVLDMLLLTLAFPVVRTPEEAGTMPGGFDYVLLSVKALPDVYDLASIIESVVTPQHTCILVNTTTALGTEAYLESRYPTNVVLSLVSGVSLNQVGTSEFEHVGGSDIWVGSAITNANVPESIQFDMAEALALTLASGSVDCHVSPNIKQQQWERVLG